MYRIILVDDEPLILAGIASLLCWENYDCTIVGKATNGPSAFQMISELAPDIVITDICMPVLNGLELVEKCRAAGHLFSFVVLTNLEEFHLAKQALFLGATDYLIKLELNEETLVHALNRAKASSDLMRLKHLPVGISSAEETPQMVFQNYMDQFLLVKDESVVAPSSLDSHCPAPFIALFSLRPVNITFHGEAVLDARQIVSQIRDVLGSIISRYIDLHILEPYDNHTFLLSGSLKEGLLFPTAMSECCTKIISALKTYFELYSVFGISRAKSSLSQLSEALREATTALEYYYYDSVSPVVFFEGQTYHNSRVNHFNINFLKKDLSASVLQNDSEHLAHIFQQIIELFQSHKPGKDHASSACINIYTYLYSFFETEDNTYRDVFPYSMNIAEQLSQLSSLSDILQWLDSFCTKLCRLLIDRKETRTDRIVEQAKRYVVNHYKEKLALSDVADALNISSGHLSNSFKKFSGITLSDYIAQVKIDEAKKLIDTHQYLIYEVADMLGFDNAYYFSKVFRKVTGVSPRDYEQSPH